MNLKNARIAVKTGLIVGVMAVAGLGIAALGLFAAGRQEALTQEIINASDRALIADQINGLVFSVVSDSRGIYMSRDAKEVEKFAPSLLSALEQIKSAVPRWKAILPADERAAFAQAEDKIGEFIAFRSELVRLGRVESPAKAREYGDNDANRANRKALNERLDALSAVTAKRVPEIRAEIVRFNANVSLALILVPLLGILAGSLLAWRVSHRHIARPLHDITSSMASLASGDLTRPIPDADRGDEVGEMARALVVFKDNMVHARDLDIKAREDQRRQVERARALEELANGFDTEVGRALSDVAAAIDGLNRTSTTLNVTATEASKRGGQVATAGERTNSGVQAVAAATEELSISIEEIARQVTASTEVAREAEARATAAEHRVSELNAAADRIGEVVKLITDIASRTNLLALNATIEAARAGEAGKGFAVVAGEVKALANQTARATGDIGGHIAEIQNGSRETSESISSIGEIIRRVNSITAAIAAAIEEQGAATREIARNVTEAARGTEEVSSNIRDVNEATEGTGRAAADVHAASTTMTREAGTLRATVDRFLERVKAG